MQHIEKDTNNFKLGNHTVRYRMQYANRTTEKKYKLPNTINNNRVPQNAKHIIYAIKKLIVLLGYLISYGYLPLEQTQISFHRSNKCIEQRTVGNNCRRSTCIEG